MAHILIAEDEQPIADLLSMALKRAGHTSCRAPDGMAATELAERERFDLALLDIMLPELDGYDVLEYLRELDVPAIFLTARGELEDRVRGLRLGADDYISKPFEVAELLARVEAVLRRTGKLERHHRLWDVALDTGSRKVTRGGQAVSLTAREYELLVFFARNRGLALYRDRIYEAVWGGDELGDSRTVDLHVQRLRKKLGWEQKLQAVYKVGYRLENEDETDLENLF